MPIDGTRSFKLEEGATETRLFGESVGPLGEGLEAPV